MRGDFTSLYRTVLQPGTYARTRRSSAWLRTIAGLTVLPIRVRTLMLVVLVLASSGCTALTTTLTSGLPADGFNGWPEAAEGSASALPESASTAVAEYGTSDETRSSPPVVGHSFAGPRVRVGRPVPLSGSNDLGTTPSAGENTSPAGSNGERSLQQSGVSEEVRASSGAVTNGAIQRAVPVEENSQEGLEVSEIGAVEPIPSELSEVHDNAATESDTASSARLNTAEPGMLNRLRGLAPRLEDNTERKRWQLGKWPDPFNLLRERELPESETREAATVRQEGGTPSAAESRQNTAELSEEASERDMEDRVDSSLNTLIEAIEQELAEWPLTNTGSPENRAQWLKRQTDLRMLCLVAGRPAEAVRMIDALPDEEQEFWQSLMLAVDRYREDASDKDREQQLTETLEHLQTAGRRLQSLSPLRIRNLLFCERIDGFGDVSEFPTADFDPGERVLLYADIRNFRTELTADGHYRSEFAAVIEFLREGEDEVVETIRIPRIQDRCDVERTDFYQSFELTVPALAGKYAARIQLRDELSQQTADGRLEFNVREGP